MKVLKNRSDAVKADASGTICLKGEEITYRMTAEEILLGEEESEPQGSFYTYTYLRTDLDTDPERTGQRRADRPVLFAFNGGPGSSSVWLHLGLFGPRRVKLADPVNPSVLPPFDLEDNPHCPLDRFDLVLIDPPETGYARLYGEETGDSFFGIEQDAAAMAEVILMWLRKYGRTGSPKYLAGESYGTVRICYLLKELAGGPLSSCARLNASAVNGVIMMGTALGMEVFSDSPKASRPVTDLYSFACVNHYYREGGKPVSEERKREALDFASSDYIRALFLGNGLNGEEKLKFASELARYTGLPAKWHEEHGWKVGAKEYADLLLKDKGLSLGLYDARYTMRAADSGNCDPVADDPAMGKYTAAFAGAWETYRQEIGLKTDRDYLLINFKSNGRWDYKTFAGRTPMQCLSMAMRRNESMRILFASGLYDLVTTAGEVRYLVNHMNLDRNRVIIGEYESGHMPYLGEESACRLEEDLRGFICGEESGRREA